MEFLDLLDVPAKRRAAALDAWRAAQADDSAAAQALVGDLAPLLDESDRASFLDAESIWTPLAVMARAATGRVASTLWAWASTASLVVGDLADHPAYYAVKALRADPGDEAAWAAFALAVASYLPPDLPDEVAGWSQDPAMGPEVARRAMDVIAEVTDGTMT
jgi:hypothetical protein